MEMPPLFPIDPDDEVDVANQDTPLEEWSDADKLRAFVLPLVGRNAQIHSLKDRTQFNGMLVTLMGYDNDLEVFECRLQKSKAMIRVGIEKLRVYNEGENAKDPRDNMMLLTGEEVRIDEQGHKFRETAGKHWRRCRDDGYWFREKVVKPVDVVHAMWHGAARSKGMQKEIAIMQMDKILTANPELLATTKVPETRAKLEAEFEKQAFKSKSAKAKSLLLKKTAKPMVVKAKGIQSESPTKNWQ